MVSVWKMDCSEGVMVSICEAMDVLSEHVWERLCIRDLDCNVCVHAHTVCEAVAAGVHVGGHDV